MKNLILSGFHFAFQMVIYLKLSFDWLKAYLAFSELPAQISAPIKQGSLLGKLFHPALSATHIQMKIASFDDNGRSFQRKAH